MTNGLQRASVKERADFAKRMELLFRIVFGGIGTALVLTACAVAGSTYTRLGSLDRVAGVVVSSERYGPSNSRFSKHVVRVQHQGKRGPLVTAVSNAPAGFDEGEPVELLFERPPSYGVQINSFWTLWYVPTIVGSFGLAMLVPVVPWGRRRPAPAAKRMPGPGL